MSNETNESTKRPIVKPSGGTMRESWGIPDGCVVIKRARGPQQAQNGLIGMVHLGGIYTVDVAMAVTLTEKGGEFDALPEFADEVEAARKAARKAAK